MRRTALLTVLFCASLAACATVYRVTDDPTTGPPWTRGGVPFFPLVSVDRTEITFEESWFEVSVSSSSQPGKKSENAGGKGDEEATQTSTVTVVTASQRDIFTLQYDLAKKTPQEAWAFVLGEFKKSPPYSATRPRQKTFAELGMALKNHQLADGGPPIDDGLTIVAIARFRDQVPSDKPMYFNVALPPGGSSTGNVELNTNGTMAKVVAEMDDALPGKLADLAGTTITAAGTLIGDGAKALSAQASGISRVELRVTPVRRLYVVKIIRSSSIREASCSPIENTLGYGASSECRASVTVTVERGDDKDAKKVDDEIHFSGSVAMPKKDSKKD